jgi:hypothetical protein
MRKVGGTIRTCGFGLLLFTSSAAFGAQVNVNCTNTIGDAAKLNTAIEKSQPGDRILIHQTCLLNATIVLLGDRTYEGDSRTGTILRQASGANLPALLCFRQLGLRLDLYGRSHSHSPADPGRQ